jgi:hypothetical protein
VWGADPDAEAAGVSRILSALEGAVASLTQRAEAAEARADAADADRRASGERADRAEQGLIGERQRADSLRERLEALQGELREAREAAAKLADAEARAGRVAAEAEGAQQALDQIRRADAARQVRGRLGRLAGAVACRRQTRGVGQSGVPPGGRGPCCAASGAGSETLGGGEAIAPPAADFEHRRPGCRYLAQQDHIGAPCDTGASPWRGC